MNFQFGFLLWGVMEKAIQKHAGDQDSYCLTEHSRGWLKITHFLAQWQRFDSSTRLQIFTSACSNVWGNCSRSTEFNKDAKVTQKVGQTNKAVPEALASSKHDKKTRQSRLHSHLCFLKGCHATAQHCRAAFANFHEQFFMFPECKREAGPIHNQSMLDNMVFLYSIQGQKKLAFYQCDRNI